MNPEKLREYVKSVILVLLFALMILFSALYFVGTQSAMISPAPDMPLDRLLIMKKGDSDNSVDSLSPDDYLPEMIAYRLDDDGGALVANRDLMRDFSQLFGEYFDVFFDSEARCSMLKRNEGEMAWNKIIAEGRYLYIRYPGELPYPLIYAFYHSKTTTALHAEGDIAFVCELLIDLDGDCALSRDRAGSYACFAHDVDGAVSFNLSALNAYDENKSFCSFRMSGAEDVGYALGIPIPEGSFSANLLLVEQVDPTLHFSSSHLRNSLLKIFDFNPDNLRSYDDNGSTVYIENHGTLILAPEGSITYEASADDGISLADILGYRSYDGEYSVGEAMRAACGLGSMLMKLSPTTADLRLDRITSDDDSGDICFVFSYFYNNIPILDGDDALRVTIEENRITSVHLTMNAYTDTLIAETMLPLGWLESHLFNLASLPNARGRCTLAYSVVKGESENRQIGCGWNYIRSGNEG